MKKYLLFLAMVIIPVTSLADYIDIDGIHYIIDVSSKTAEVTSNPTKYSGEIVIPQSINYESDVYNVTSIGNMAFYQCFDLTSVSIPNSVNSIGQHAFYGCGGISSIRIPDGVKSIGDDAFNFCRGISEINIPSSVEKIGIRVFYECSALQKVIISNGLSTISYDAFGNCASLKEVEIPNSVTKIESHAFWKCSSLTTITIPNSVQEIGPSTFQYCKNLSSISLSKSITKIDDFTFERCNSLETITIPESVNNIGESAFAGCSNLKSITVNSTTPIAFPSASRTRSGSSVFEGVDKNTCVLYVPEGCVEVYKAAPVWGEFTNILVIGTSSINGILFDSYKTQDVYGLDGRKVRPNATSVKDLPKGVYIIKGKKVLK